MGKREKYLLKVGMPPGTLLYTGSKRNGFEINYIKYNEKFFEEGKILNIENCQNENEYNQELITWINVVGIHKEEIIEKIGKYFNLHSLTLEDILNIYQRPKLEEFEDYIFIVLKDLKFEKNGNLIDLNQISIVIKGNYIITFSEKHSNIFDNLIEHIRKNMGIIRKKKIDYLLYRIVDTIVDNYFTILDKLEEKIEVIEDNIISETSKKTIKSIQTLKRNMINFRKTVRPLREILNSLIRDMRDYLSDSILYFRDTYDHVIQIIEELESIRDQVSSTLDIFLTTVNNKINHVMKILTVISTIFMPITFISGIYGMNFKYMPELYWKWSYPVVLAVMSIIVIFLIIIFKRKKWL